MEERTKEKSEFVGKVLTSRANLARITMLLPNPFLTKPGLGREALLELEISSG